MISIDLSLFYDELSAEQRYALSTLSQIEYQWLQKQIADWLRNQHNDLQKIELKRRTETRYGFSPDAA